MGHVVDGGEVFIDVLPTVEASYAADFQRAVAHEIGHAMQLEHDAPGDLMAAMLTEDAPAPTCARTPPNGTRPAARPARPVLLEARARHG